MPLLPLSAENEIGKKPDFKLLKIKKDTAQKRILREAFSNGEISSERLLKAPAQFTGSLVSSDSKHDRVKRGEVSFVLSEQEGNEIFKVSYNSYH